MPASLGAGGESVRLQRAMGLEDRGVLGVNRPERHDPGQRPECEQHEPGFHGSNR